MDECLECRLFDRAAPPCVDADVDHAAALAPAFVDVAVEQPSALVDWTMLDEPVLIVAVPSIWEVAREDSMDANLDVCLSLMDLDEAGGEVPLGPTFGASTVAGGDLVTVELVDRLLLATAWFRIGPSQVLPPYEQGETERT